MTRTLAMSLTVGLAASPAGVGAQTVSDTRRRFDVVSVKPNTSDEPELRLDVQPGGRLVAINIPLIQFIRAAYTLQLSQIVDVPPWVERERFDITAVTDRDLSGPTVWRPGTYAPVQLMMQGVLADRFRLVAHTEAREAPGYALVRRGPDRERGKLVPHTDACTPTTYGMQIAPGSVRARGVPLPQLAELLSELTSRLVIDASGLEGSLRLRDAATEFSTFSTGLPLGGSQWSRPRRPRRALGSP
jgi:uncharacterized protein (TIGR03435 family)